LENSRVVLSAVYLDLNIVSNIEQNTRFPPRFVLFPVRFPHRRLDPNPFFRLRPTAARNNSNFPAPIFGALASIT